MEKIIIDDNGDYIKHKEELDKIFNEDNERVRYLAEEIEKYEKVRWQFDKPTLLDRLKFKWIRFIGKLSLLLLLSCHNWK